MFEHPPCTVSHLSIRESICRNTNSCDNFTILNGERFNVISIVEFKSHAGNNIYTCICCKVISFKYKSFCGIYIYIALYEFMENSSVNATLLVSFSRVNSLPVNPLALAILQAILPHVYLSFMSIVELFS